MRLFNISSAFRTALCFAAGGLLAAAMAGAAVAEPSNHGTSLDLDLDGPSALAGPQDDGPASQPKPVYPDGEPALDTIESVVEDDIPADGVKTSNPVIVATVDKGEQRMTVFVDGVEKYSWPVSTGIAGYSTPSGTFTASSMNEIWYSRQWDNAPMPHAVFFTKKGHAIHATKEVKKLGKPASHGCVRLSPENAKTFFNLVKDKGLDQTEVVLTGVTPGGEYKITQPPAKQPVYPNYSGSRNRYGYNQPPPVYRERRRMFQPYMQAPPPQYQPPRQPRRGFFRRRSY